MKILIIKTSSLGDCVHCLPVLADIRACHPQAEIHWLVEEAYAPLLRLHPELAQVWPVAWRRWRKSLYAPRTWREMSQFWQRLQSQHYDWVIDTQGLLKSAVLAMLTHSKHRVGYNRHSIREAWASWFYSQRYAVSRTLHAVPRNRALVAAALGVNIPDTPTHYGLPQAHVAQQDVVLGLHGSAHAAKHWPLAQWVTLGQALASQNLTLCLPWGDEAERQLAQRIATLVKGAQVLPRCALPELLTVISRARVAVGVDSGLTHLALALGLPTVGIYCATAPTLNGLYGSSPHVNLGGVGVEVPADVVLLAVQGLLALAATQARLKSAYRDLCKSSERDEVQGVRNTGGKTYQ